VQHNEKKKGTPSPNKYAIDLPWPKKVDNPKREQEK
jgi:hypothetical protein